MVMNKLVVGVVISFVSVAERWLLRTSGSAGNWSGRSLRTDTMAAISCLVTLLIFSAPVAVYQTAATLIVKNTGISVRYGRAQFLQPENLRVNRRLVDSAALCIFSVTSSDGSVGSVWPQTFACRIARDTVRYVHMGSLREASDRISLQLKLFTANATLMELVDVRVKVMGGSDDLDIVTRRRALNVRMLGGFSGRLDDRIFRFEYNETTENCQVMSLSLVYGPPYVGQLLNPGSETGLGQSCDDFLKSKVRYRHSGWESPDIDYIPFYVHVIDLRGEILRMQYFWVTVRIDPGISNSPPLPDPSSLFYMTVSQFVTSSIRPEALHFNDPDSQEDHLIIQVTRSFNENEGCLMHVDRPGIPLRSFYQEELTKLKIVYQPPAITSSVIQQIELDLVAMDPYGAKTAVTTFQFYIQPVNTLTPVVTLNRGLLLLEGQSRVLSPRTNLQISDKDSRDRIIITATNSPIHGRLLVRGRPSVQFTTQDLDDEVVVYQHDHSDSQQDDITFSVFDGSHAVAFLFLIAIEPVDDQPPVLTTHTVVMVLSGGHAQLGNRYLNAHDDNSEYSEINYIVDYELGYLLFGTLSKHPGFYPSPSAIRQIQNFTQSDINEGMIYYEHSGLAGKLDSFAFRLADAHDPPNFSDIQVVLIKIQPADIHSPKKSQLSVPAIVVDENSTVVITRQHLAYTDMDSQDKSLVYEITRAPYFVDTVVSSAGQLVGLLSLSPKAVSTFTQAEVNYHKVFFQAPQTEVGTMSQRIRFEFRVRDQGGNSIDGQQFDITLHPVNSQAPQIVTGRLLATHGISASITTSELSATDPDTELNHLLFHVRVLPIYGHLSLSGTETFDQHTVFKMADIVSGNLSYISDASLFSTTDSFIASVTDGKYTDEQQVDISIDIPSPSFPYTVQSVVKKTVTENGSILLSLDDIITLHDIPTTPIVFNINSGPSQGRVMSNHRLATTFSYQDLSRGDVHYVHSGKEIGTEPESDRLQLSVVVNGSILRNGSTPASIVVVLTILPADNKPPILLFDKKMFVDEGGRVGITSSEMIVTDPDSPVDVLHVQVKKACQYGYLENVRPIPGSEINNKGKPVKHFSLTDLMQGMLNYVQSVHKSVEPVKDRCKLIATDGKNKSPVGTLKVFIRGRNDEAPQLLISNLSVVEEGGKLNLVVLYKASDMDTPDVNLTYRITSLPRHGAIIYQSLGTQLTSYTQRMLSRNEVVYQHDGSESKADEFQVQLTDGVHVVPVPAHTQHITVTPVDDLQPRVMVNNGLVVRANETKVLSTRVLHSVDGDTDEGRLIYVITEAEGEGFLQRRGLRGVKATDLKVGMNFTQEDLLAGHIAYIHLARRQKNATTREYFKFTVTDGVNPTPDVFFFVTVLPQVLPNLKVVNKLARVNENSLLVLTTDLLTATDGTTNSRNIRFTVTRPPEKGRLESTLFPGIPVKTFSQIDLAASRVRYVHTIDDGTLYDGFVYHVTNSYQLLTRTFVISIEPIDDSLPVVESYGMVVSQGTQHVISVLMLRASDADTRPSKVTFILHQLPDNGQLVRTRNSLVEVVSDQFTQMEIDRGQIAYQHNGGGSVKDSFLFTVSDGVNLKFHVHPNMDRVTSRPQTFDIVIEPSVDQRPVITVNTGIQNLQRIGSLTIGGVLKSRMLKAEINGKEDAGLVYVVVERPAKGRVVFIEFDGFRQVDNYTQSQLGSIAYILLAPFDHFTTSDSFIIEAISSDGTHSLPAVIAVDWAWIWFDSHVYKVGENIGSFSVGIMRSGNIRQSSFVDIAAVSQTAHRAINFITSSARLLQFDPGERRDTWRVGIVDDGVKTEEPLAFSVSISNPVNALVFPGEDTAKIFIYDAILDITG